jgi:hypothetical protein
MLRGTSRAQHASTHKTRGLTSCTHAMSCLAQNMGKYKENETPTPIIRPHRHVGELPCITGSVSYPSVAQYKMQSTVALDSTLPR